MENQKIIYFVLILLVFVLLFLGYYLFFYSKDVAKEVEDETINEEKTISNIKTIRNNAFLVHGIIDSLERGGDGEIILNVNIDMVENFEFSPFQLATKRFLLKKDSKINTSEKDDGEDVIVIKEEFTLEVDDFSVLSEGDLVLINTEESLLEIADKDIFTIVEIWKILEK